jgi:hypothetical protein
MKYRERVDHDRRLSVDGFPLRLPLTLALSPQAGRGNRAALVQLSLPLHSASDLGSGGRSEKNWGCFSITRLRTVSS